MSAFDTSHLRITLKPAHRPEVERIYFEGIATRKATFETGSLLKAKS